MNLFGLNGGYTNFFGRANGGSGVSGSLVPAMAGTTAGSINGSSIGGGLNAKGSLPSVDVSGLYPTEPVVEDLRPLDVPGSALDPDTQKRMATSKAAIANNADNLLDEEAMDNEDDRVSRGLALLSGAISNIQRSKRPSYVVVTPYANSYRMSSFLGR